MLATHVLAWPRLSRGVTLDPLPSKIYSDGKADFTHSGGGDFVLPGVKEYQLPHGNMRMFELPRHVRPSASASHGTGASAVVGGALTWYTWHRRGRVRCKVVRESDPWQVTPCGFYRCNHLNMIEMCGQNHAVKGGRYFSLVFFVETMRIELAKMVDLTSSICRNSI